MRDAPNRELSVVGRWLSPDPAGMAAVDPSDPQSWNRYAYVRNSPLNHTDRLGLGDDGGDCDPSDPSCGGGGDPCFDYGICGDGPGGPGEGQPPLPIPPPPVYKGGANGPIWQEISLPYGGPSPLQILQAVMRGDVVGALQDVGALPTVEVSPIMDAANYGPACLAGAGPLQVGQSRCAAIATTGCSAYQTGHRPDLYGLCQYVFGNGPRLNFIRGCLQANFDTKTGTYNDSSSLGLVVFGPLYGPLFPAYGTLTHAYCISRGIIYGQ